MDETAIKDSDKGIFIGGSDWGNSNNWYWKGIKCRWRVLGENNQKPLLFLHGFGANSSHWRKNAEPFAKAGYRVYGIDLIGFGDSDQPSRKRISKLDNHFWAEQVAAFIEQIVHVNTQEKTVLVGNSLGSLTAITTLSFYPELIAAVVAAPLPDPAFMEPVNFNQPAWLENLRNLLLKIFFSFLPLEILVPFIARTKLLRIGLQAAYVHPIKHDKELLRLISKPAQRPTAARALRAMCVGMATRKQSITAPALLQRLSIRRSRSPILLLWGREDKFVPLKVGQSLKKQHPWLGLYIFEETGHCPHDEIPNQFNKIVLNWLATNLADNQQQI